MILFYITSISDLMVNLLLEKVLTNDVFVATPRKEVYDIVSSWGINALWMTTDIALDRRELDRQFRDDFMPGIFGDAVFPDTNLEAWQVLSLDRLKFWYRPHIRSEVDFLRSMRFGEAYVSLDMGDSIPFALSHIFDVTAVKTEPVRTREVLDMGELFEFVGYVVDSEYDAKFLERAGVGGEITMVETDEPEPAKYPDRATLKETMNLPDTVLGIMFDPRYEHQCRKLFDIFDTGVWPTVFVFPIHQRAAELMPHCLREHAGKYSVMSEYASLAVCDEIVAFTYDENYFQNPPAKMVIYDVNGLNKARELAPEYEIRGMPV